jgi:hypothetical protein
MSDDAKNLGKAEAKASQHDEPADEVEAHAKHAGKAEHSKPGMTDELASDENEVEAHHFRQGGKAEGKAE